MTGLIVSLNARAEVEVRQSMLRPLNMSREYSQSLSLTNEIRENERRDFGVRSGLAATSINNTLSLHPSRFHRHLLATVFHRLHL